eukprot:TRINITY_DN12709_c0_g1_i3.p1 TRINITY_DN12709_c0_g1~~TRINITY_DN12709_c0_g1_i3.p1  ORF type:complete len:303 (+),score=54.13 TRINITY_DN12709_c0_g1_i3:524-1432(+)
MSDVWNVSVQAVLSMMRKQMVQPNTLTLTAVLSGALRCSKDRWSAEKIVAAMEQGGVYTRPTAHTYTALLSIYGTRGEMQLAADVLTRTAQRRIRADGVMYGALIGAYGAHARSVGDRHVRAAESHFETALNLGINTDGLWCKMMGVYDRVQCAKACQNLLRRRVSEGPPLTVRFLLRLRDALQAAGDGAAASRVDGLIADRDRWYKDRLMTQTPAQLYGGAGGPDESERARLAGRVDLLETAPAPAESVRERSTVVVAVFPLVWTGARRSSLCCRCSERRAAEWCPRVCGAHLRPTSVCST